METIKITCDTKDHLAISELSVFQGNLKDLSDENYQKLKKDIIELGWCSPIHVWRNDGINWILDGTQRLRTATAMQNEGFIIPKIPVVFIDASDAKEAAKKVLSLTSQFGEITNDGLYEFINSKGLDFQLDVMESFRFPEIDFADFYKEFVDELSDTNGNEDEVPEVKETISKTGDLWILGDHRVLCGDSTKIEDVERLMNGQKADMVFTDPPYGIDLDTSGSMSKTSMKHRKVIGDDKEYDPLHILSFFEYCKEIFIWGANYFAFRLPRGTWIVWDKKSDDEIDTNLDGRFGSDIECCWSKAKNKMTLVRKIVPTGFFCRGDDKIVHPTMKPTRLCEWFINKFSKETNLIWDGYLGSGSTLMACEKTNRKCYGIEIDPHYVDVICQRWADFTGKDPVRESDGAKWSALVSQMTT